MDKQIDTSKYRSLLCRLASKAHRSDFNDLFKQVLIKANIPDNLHFILKMELKRLQKPCARQIDLRGYVDGECHPFVFENKTHYLDNLAKSVFQDQYENFNGYTVGVFECVNNTPNNYRVMHEKEKNSKKPEQANDVKKNIISYEVPALAFDNFHSRKEERMHYVSDVALIQKDEALVIGRTVDISASGCQLKTYKNVELKKDQIIQLKFKKLEEEFALGLKKGLDYKVIAIDTTDPEFNIVRLSRRSCDLTLRFDDFLKNYITGNKRRYKINLDNTIHSVMNRGYAQYSMPRRSDLNIFLKEDMLDLQPFMAVITELNREIVEYWQDSGKNLFVGHALTIERLSILRDKLSKGISDSYLYTFSGINSRNEKVFYSALKEELDDNEELKKLFLTLGNTKYDFKVFNLHLSESSEEFAYQPFSLMTDEISVFKKLNKRPSARVMHRLKGLSHVLSMKDITTDFNRQDYVYSEVNNSLVSKVREFKVDRVPTGQLQIAPIKFVDLRREERYAHNTSVLIRSEKRVFEGQSIDLSTKGLRVRFDEPVDLYPKTEVLVDYPEFDKEHENIKLTRLRYRIVSVNEANTEACLTISGDQREHNGRIFLRDLINKNKNFLLDYQTGLQDLELSWCVQNILSSSSTAFTAYVKRKGRRFMPVIASPGSFESKLFKKFINGDSIDLEFLFKTDLYKDFLETGLGHRHLVNASNKHDIYFSFKNGEMEVKLDIDFKSKAEKVLFVKDAHLNGEFYCVNGSIAKTGRPDLSRVSAELNYISMYAMHKGKEIEEELWSVCGIMDFKDITEEVINRLNILYRPDEKAA